MNRPSLPFLRLARIAWLAPSLGVALAMARLSPPDDLFPGLPGDFGASLVSRVAFGWSADRIGG